MRLPLAIALATLAGCSSPTSTAPVPSVARVREPGIIVRTKIVEVQADTRDIQAKVAETQSALETAQAIAEGLEKRIAAELQPELSTLRARLNDAEVAANMAGVKLAEVSAALADALQAKEQQERAEVELQASIKRLAESRDQWRDEAEKFEAKAGRAEAQLGHQTWLAWKWRLVTLAVISGVVALFWFRRAIIAIPVVGPIIGKLFL